jgi:hypothetical protein
LIFDVYHDCVCWLFSQWHENSQQTQSW